MPSAPVSNAIRGLLVFGFGGHARSVADVAVAAGINEICFVDEKAREGESFLGFPVVKTWSPPIPEGWGVFPASGDNRLRQQQCASFDAFGLPVVTLIAPNATIGIGSSIGPGCFIAHHAHIGPAARIDKGCIINTGAIVDHESSVGEFSHVSVNATIAGRSHVGRLTMIGAGATVIDYIEIADEVIVGAGCLVRHSINAAGVYVGMPVKKLR
jgi:sugar O-acyltransferase (sialic acid O-acetyltransferase NeuD family)